MRHYSEMTPDEYVDWCINSPYPIDPKKLACEVAMDLILIATGLLDTGEPWLTANAAECLRVLQEKGLLDDC
jgi:hypothetical protein